MLNGRGCALLATCLLMALVGCSSSDNGGGGGGGDNPTFTQVYNDVIVPKCQSCHVQGGSGVSQGNLDLSTKSLAYQNLVGPKSSGSACGSLSQPLVTGGSPGNSLLFKKVSADPGNAQAPCGAKMPEGTAGLDQNLSDEVKTWIVEGAPNN